MFTSRICLAQAAPTLTGAARLWKYSAATREVVGFDSEPRPLSMKADLFDISRETQQMDGRDTPPTFHYCNEQDAVSNVQIVAQSLKAISITSNSAPLSLPRRAAPNSKSVTNVAKMDRKAKSEGKKDGGRQNAYIEEREKPERDDKVSPSTGSGGIPNPTSAYIDQSKAAPRLSSEPQNLLVVIDLNGTLLFRPSKKNPTKFIARPHARRFLEYCANTFTVLIWSSARPGNVANMCSSIVNYDLRKKIIATWGRDRFGLTPEDYDKRVQCYKRLTKVWTDPKIAATHPAYDMGGRWDATNTVLIDDSLEKARSEPFNLVEVPEFFGNVDEDGDILPQVHDYLNYLSMHSNVTACVRAQPFKAGAPIPTPNLPRKPEGNSDDR